MKTYKSVLLLCAIQLSSTVALWGFSVPIHELITQEGLSALDVNIGGITRHFTPAAIQSVQKANGDVDHSTPALFFPARHFTDEKLTDGSQRLIDLKKSILDVLRQDPPNGEQARKSLGEAFHAVQDFYSHSTWVEGGNPGIDTRLGKDTIPDPVAAVQPCDAATSVTSSGSGLSSGYYLGLAGCGNSTYVPPFPDLAPFRADFTVNLDAIADGKCYHGNYTMACIGMNKDNDTPTPPSGYTATDVAVVRAGGVAPANPLHSIARAKALAATMDYVQQIIDELDGNERAIAALLGVRSVGFVVDTTGSMEDEIDGVKAQMQNIVNFLKNEPPERRPTEWILETFNDPGVGTPYVTDSADNILSVIGGITVDGGGDCPELSQQGTLRAVDAALPGARLYIVTDADAKDAGLANTVISRAVAKGIRLIPLLTGTCGGGFFRLVGGGQDQTVKITAKAAASAATDADPVYLREALETGGQLFLLGKSELENVLQLIIPQLAGDLQTIATSQGTFAASLTTNTFAVDSSVSRIVVSAYIASDKLLAIKRPDGTVVTNGSPGAQVIELSTGFIAIIESSAPGTWTLEIGGTGDYSIVVEGNSPLSFFEFAFVEPNEDIHGGYFPIAGRPVAGTNSFGQATLLGPYGTPAFSFIDQGGSEISSLALMQGFANASRISFTGPLTVPAAPFRIRARGLDTNGFAFQRVYPSVFEAQTLGVEVASTNADSIPCGGSRELHFSVRNLGSPGTFIINVVPSIGSVTSISASSVTLGANESTNVISVVSIPRTVGAGATVVVTATATRSDDSASFNSASVTLGVVGSCGNVEILSQILNTNIDRQTGLFYQQVVITNGGSDSVSGFRLSVTNLPASAWCVSATGTNAGMPFVEFSGSLASGQTLTFTLAYYTSNRQPPLGVGVSVESASVTSPPPSTGQTLSIRRAFLRPDGKLAVEFDTLAGRAYVVEYSSDMTNWKQAQPPVLGTGSRLMWADNGPPQTESPPASGPRFYRLVLLPQ